jgi:hypothetical protein
MEKKCGGTSLLGNKRAGKKYAGTIRAGTRSHGTNRAETNRQGSFVHTRTRMPWGGGGVHSCKQIRHCNAMQYVFTR